MFWNARNGKIALDGTDMYFVSFGRGARTLILLPGLSDGLATVKGKALLLAKPYTPFFRDCTVYMFSRKNDMPPLYTIRDMAADQARAMETLGITSACVMGVSQGGMIAQYLAADYPQLVDRLILAVTAPCLSDMTERCLRNWIELAQQGNHRQLMIDTAEKSYSEAFLKKYRKLYPMIGWIGKPASYDRFLVNARAILSFDASNEMQNITCPTLIIGGEEDRIVGAEASHALKAGIADSVLYIYPGLGHGAYEEAPDFNLRVFRFLMGAQGNRIQT